MSRLQNNMVIYRNCQTRNKYQ